MVHDGHMTTNEIIKRNIAIMMLAIEILISLSGARIRTIKIMRSASSTFSNGGMMGLKGAKDLMDAACMLTGADNASGWKPRRTAPVLADHLETLALASTVLEDDALKSLIGTLRPQADEHEVALIAQAVRLLTIEPMLY